MRITNERLRDLEETATANAAAFRRMAAQQTVAQRRREYESAATREDDHADVCRAVLAVRELCKVVERMQLSDMDEPLGARRILVEDLRAIVGAAEGDR